MKLLLVDSSPSALAELKRLCQTVDPEASCAAFTKRQAALDHAAHEDVDLLFFSVSPPHENVSSFVTQLRETCPAMQVAFIAEKEDFAMDAWRADACAYLLKPVDAGAVRRALEKARRLRGVAGPDRIELSTFGRFDLFLNGRAVKFKHEKARELLALMTARLGGTTTMDVIIDRLWEGEEYTNAVKVKYRKAVMHLRQTLNSLGLSWMLHAARGQIWMDFTGVKCDFFGLIHGDPRAFALYHGAFMTEFSWSEYYLPMTEHLAQEFSKNN